MPDRVLDMRDRLYAAYHDKSHTIDDEDSAGGGAVFFVFGTTSASLGRGGVPAGKNSFCLTDVLQLWYRLWYKKTGGEKVPEIYA